MEETTIGAVLFDGIEENPYLNELYDAILYNYGRQLFGLTNLPEKEISVPAALRFADILSKSVHTQNEETHKLWAQEIVALLNALRPDDELIQYYLGSVLTSVSNFRGVSLKAADYVSADFLDRIFTQVSKEYLRIPEAENEYFFRAQKEIYEKFNEPYFSYSAPTSLGKSYIMRTFIREQIAKGKQCNFAIIVPTKALINETTEKLTEVLGPELKEKNYRIVTSAGAMALEEEHTLRFFVANKPNALIVDFFAGSGTTLHAVNLLNAEDGGHRRCILVTNNEVSADEAKTLSAQGYQPGDPEWEQYGIARYVTWPRTVCSIEGHDVNGKPLKGDYITSGEEPMHMADGFKANAAFFKLGFLDKNAVALGRQFKELLPVLWLKAGAHGPCPSLEEAAEVPAMLVLPENHFAVLTDESQYETFATQVNIEDAITMVYIVTDSEPGYREMISGLHAEDTYQLYRDYLDNFRINHGGR